MREKLHWYSLEVWDAKVESEKKKKPGYKISESGKVQRSVVPAWIFFSVDALQFFFFLNLFSVYLFLGEREIK